MTPRRRQASLDSAAAVLAGLCFELRVFDGWRAWAGGPRRRKSAVFGARIDAWGGAVVAHAAAQPVPPSTVTLISQSAGTVCMRFSMSSRVAAFGRSCVHRALCVHALQHVDLVARVVVPIEAPDSFSGQSWQRWCVLHCSSSKL